MASHISAARGMRNVVRANEETTTGIEVVHVSNRLLRGSLFLTLPHKVTRNRTASVSVLVLPMMVITVPTSPSP